VHYMPVPVVSLRQLLHPYEHVDLINFDCQGVFLLLPCPSRMWCVCVRARVGVCVYVCVRARECDTPCTPRFPARSRLPCLARTVSILCRSFALALALPLKRMFLLVAPELRALLITLSVHGVYMPSCDAHTRCVLFRA